jgi:hypothetical protein
MMEGIIDHKTDVHVIDSDDMYIKHVIDTQVRKQPRLALKC